MNFHPFIGKWIRFLPTGALFRKTGVWTVETNDMKVLGVVKFYPKWRKYAFFPEDGTLFECDCLRDIADFCADRTHEWRQAIKERKIV